MPTYKFVAMIQCHLHFQDSVVSKEKFETDICSFLREKIATETSFCEESLKLTSFSVESLKLTLVYTSTNVPFEIGQVHMFALAVC